MSAWDEPSVKIGKSAGGGGGGPRSVVARGRAEQNAAARAGNLSATKKIGSLNASNQNHQKAWKTENAERYVMEEKNDNKKRLEANLTRLQNTLGLDRTKLAQDASSQVGRLWVKDGSGSTHDYDAVRRIELKYCWTINGKWGPKRKLRDTETQLLEYHEKLKPKPKDEKPRDASKPLAAGQK